MPLAALIILPFHEVSRINRTVEARGRLTIAAETYLEAISNNNDQPLLVRKRFGKQKSGEDHRSVFLFLVAILLIILLLATYDRSADREQQRTTRGILSAMARIF